jgi:hypothetical protein
VAILHPFRQRLEADPFELRGQIANQLTRGLRLVVAHLS